MFFIVDYSHGSFCLLGSPHKWVGRRHGQFFFPINKDKIASCFSILCLRALHSNNTTHRPNFAGTSVEQVLIWTIYDNLIFHMLEFLFVDKKHNLIWFWISRKSSFRKVIFQTKVMKKLTIISWFFCNFINTYESGIKSNVIQRSFFSTAQKTAQKYLKVFCIHVLEFNFATISCLECFIFAKRWKLLYPSQGFLLIILAG